MSNEHHQEMTTDATHSAPEKATDPVCGMKVDREHSPGGTFEHAGATYYFCNPKCRQKFAEQPATYLDPKPTPALQPQREAAPSTSNDSTGPKERVAAYVCPMDPEVRASKPGACPKCGLALEPEDAAPTTRTDWICPMHPEVVRDAPGSCPICGMALEPRVIIAEPDHPELRDMSRRFRVSVALSAPLFALAMGDMRLGHRTSEMLPAQFRGFLEPILAKRFVESTLSWSTKPAR